MQRCNLPKEYSKSISEKLINLILDSLKSPIDRNKKALSFFYGFPLFSIIYCISKYLCCFVTVLMYN